MCKHDNHDRPRLGARLEDGHAHSEDHDSWSRRSFMASLGLGGAGLMLGGTPSIRGFFSSPVLKSLAAGESDRVLVVIRLNGGNDGLNTVVPFADPLYHEARKRLRIGEDQVLKLGDTPYGLHPALAELHPFFGGNTSSPAFGSIIHSVGYPDPSMSHFDSSDIWQKGQRASEASGWLGRYLGNEHPDYWSQAPTSPLAIQFGGSNSLSLESGDGDLGVSISSDKMAKRLLSMGAAYEVDLSVREAAASERAYVRAITNNTSKYAAAIHEAGQSGENDPDAGYHSGKGLAFSLATIARLIKSRQLGTRIYMVTLNGFDTHNGQKWRHQSLLTNLSKSLSAFLKDLGPEASRTLVMTVSEFGRRVQENANGGTDHGAAGPMMLFGGHSDNGTFLGRQTYDLSERWRGSLAYQTDFRDVYASVLSSWFGLGDASTVLPDAPLNDSFQLGDGQSGRIADGVTHAAAHSGVSLLQNYPEPFNPMTNIGFELQGSAHVTVRVFDLQGRLVANVADGHYTAGKHDVRFDASRLPSGTYFYRMISAGTVHTKQMTVVK